MATRRQLQVGELVKRQFSSVLFEEGRYIYGPEVMVSVTSVNMSSDLGLAKIYISVYNTENKQAVMLSLEEQLYRLKQALQKKIRKHVRRIPDIALYLDDTLDEMDKLNRLFDQIHERDEEK